MSHSQNVLKEKVDNSKSEAEKIKALKLAAATLRHTKANTILSHLKILFPKTFSDTKVPLKKDIYKDVLAFWEKDKSALPEASKKILHFSFDLYTRNLAYHKACAKVGAKRIDLDGNSVADVTEQERAYHQENIDRILAARKKKKNKQKKVAIDKANKEIIAQGKATIGTQFSDLLMDDKK